jgi:hypothetical protein
MPKRVDPELGGPTRYRGGADGVQAGRGRQKSLWRWVAPAEIDGGEAPGSRSRRPRRTARLREDATLKAATTFVGELDPRNG